jgi:hypothetical protein
MKVGELRARLDKVPTAYDDLEVCVWLPGSRLTLDSWIGFARDHGNPRLEHKTLILVEGSIEPGSLLGDDA